MKQIILLLAAGLVLASCGSTRKITSSTTQRSDSTATQQTASTKDSAGVSLATTEKVKITTTKIDTTVRLKADSLEGTIPINPKDTGIKTNVIESGGLKIQTTYDPTTGSLHVKTVSKPKDVPVQAETTTLEREASTDSKASTVSTQDNQSASVSTSSSSSSKQSSVTKKPGLLQALWPWWLIALILVLLYLFWRYRPTITNALAAVRRRLRI